jgi:hypothetical protein
MNLRDYLYEGSDRASLFSKAKALALSTAKSLGRSTKSISKSSSTSDLENAVSSWKYSKDPKAKSTYKNIINTLSKKPDDAPKSPDDARKEMDDTKKSTMPSNSTDSGNKIETETSNMNPQEAKEYELTAKQKENDIQRFSDKIIKSETRVKDSKASLGKFIENLIKLLAPDVSLNLSDTSSIDNRIEMMNNINDMVDSIDEYKNAFTDDIKIKLEAQDKILKDREEELAKMNCPEVNRVESKRKKDVEDKIKKALSNDFKLKVAYEKYKYLLDNIDILTPDERKELEGYQNGDIGKLISDIGKEFPILSKEKKEEMNTKWRESEIKKTRAKVQANKSDLENDLKNVLSGFNGVSGDVVKVINKYRKKIEKGKVTEEDSKELSSAIELYKDELSKYNKQAEEEQSKREEEREKKQGEDNE